MELPTLPFQESAVGMRQLAGDQCYRGYRKDYSLGETARSPSHMIIEPISTGTTHEVSSLSKHDHAFVKRSDGSFSYAIVAYRCLKPFKSDGRNSVTMEECIVFVVSSDGSTKLIRKSMGDCVRLVANVVHPDIISCFPLIDDEDCSLISSVSDRARGHTEASTVGTFKRRSQTQD
jgi:hypothetical protein